MSKRGNRGARSPTNAVVASQLDTLHAEVERLAHASPAPPDRDARVRELKAAIGHLSRYRHTRKEKSRVAAGLFWLGILSCVLLVPLIVLVAALARDARGLPGLTTDGSRWFIKETATLLFVVACVLGREWYTNRTGVRRAIALAKELDTGHNA